MPRSNWCAKITSEKSFIVSKKPDSLVPRRPAYRQSQSATSHFRSDIDLGTHEFRANTLRILHRPDAWISNLGVAEVAVFFARPVSPLLTREQVENYCRYGQRNVASGCWM